MLDSVAKLSRKLSNVFKTVSELLGLKSIEFRVDDRGVLFNKIAAPLQYLKFSALHVYFNETAMRDSGTIPIKSHRPSVFVPFMRAMQSFNHDGISGFRAAFGLDVERNQFVLG
ncbi:MAG: hypothetical protein M3126_03045 [Candidatus Eremiobacteraeota bacterium]|nr:hypothetical protein [Candidatus Eremiobacteraeota bacterium]